MRWWTWTVVAGAATILVAGAVAMWGEGEEQSTSCPAADVACMGDVLVEAARTDGVGAVATAVAALDAEVCHDVSHHAGRALGPELLDQVLRADDGVCHFGLSHGALEGWALAADESEFSATWAGVCDNADAGPRRQNCVHGLGHAVAVRYGEGFGDLLVRCNALNRDDRSSCVQGVVMAYLTSRRSLGPGEQLTPVERQSDDELARSCNRGVDGVADACWGQLWQLVEPGDAGTYLSTLSELCPTAGPHTEVCWIGLGRALVWREPPTDPDGFDVTIDTAVGRCRTVKGSSGCISGVADAAAAWWEANHDNMDAYPGVCDRVEARLAAACSETEANWRAHTQTGALPAGELNER
jgi:hypothetical protein